MVPGCQETIFASRPPGNRKVELNKVGLVKITFSVCCRLLTAVPLPHPHFLVPCIHIADWHL